MHLEKALRELFGEFYEVRDEGCRIVAEYEDADFKETITLEFVKHGYELTVEVAFLDEEIHTPESCHDCFNDCPYFDEDGCKLSDEEIEEEIREWTSRAPVKSLDQLIVEPTIIEIWCPVNMPHYHIYKGVRMTFRTGDPNEVLAFLTLRGYFERMI